MTSLLRRSLNPGWLWVPAGIGLFLCAGPLLALILNVPWAALPRLLSTSEAVQALLLSLTTAAISTVICCVIGTPLAVLFARLHGPLMTFTRGLLLLPLVLSPVVSGIALLYFWGRRGLAGQPLSFLGIETGFSPLAVILVQVFVSLPFFVVVALSAITSVEPELELTAATSGAGPTQILRYITLPLALPGLLAGSLLAFARSLGEYGATITFAGSVAGRTRTLPLQIELSLNSNQPETALGLSLMLICLYLVVLILARSGALRLIPVR